MSQQRILNHYTRILSRWPVDVLRQEDRQFQRIIASRIQKPEVNSLSGDRVRDPEREINAAYLLLDNTFAQRFSLSDKTMRPASDPEHYSKLATELEEIPDRSWIGRMVKRVTGMVRMR